MELNTRGPGHTDTKPHRMLKVAALASVIAASGCVSGNPGGTNIGGPTPTQVFTSIPAESAPLSGARAAAVGDAAAISKCQAAENTQEAKLLVAGDTMPALTVVAGFDTTAGDAHRYADSIGSHPGDPSPRPAQSSAYYTSTTPVVACILDGFIEAPNLPGNRPYSRELALIGPHGILQQLVAGRTDTISLQNPASAPQQPANSDAGSRREVRNHVAETRPPPNIL